jgi:hypothetical protein
VHHVWKLVGVVLSAARDAVIEPGVLGVVHVDQALGHALARAVPEQLLLVRVGRHLLVADRAAQDLTGDRGHVIERDIGGSGVTHAHSADMGGRFAAAVSVEGDAHGEHSAIGVHIEVGEHAATLQAEAEPARPGRLHRRVDRDVHGSAA